MAIRYDAALNAEIRRVVKNFNQKRNRAIKRGFSNLPPTMKVSELKARYEKRPELLRELKLISKFNQEDALETIENSGGAKAIKWEVKYLKENLKKAKEFYDREIYELSATPTELGISKQEILNNLRSKRSFLDLEISQLNQSDYTTYKATINEYLRSNLNKKQSYRNWLNEVEVIMRHLGYDNKTINKFFEGFEELTPSQFITMYRQSNLVSRIYELYIPSRSGDFRLSTTEDDAKGLIDTFIEQKDAMIEKAKATDSMVKGEGLEEFAKSVRKMNYGADKPKKYKLEDLTKEQIEMWEALGGNIEDLLK